MSILNGDDAKTNRPAGFIAPIGPVSGDANLDGADPILREEGQSKKEEEGESKHTVTNNIPRRFLFVFPLRILYTRE